MRGVGDRARRDRLRVEAGEVGGGEGGIESDQSIARFVRDIVSIVVVVDLGVHRNERAEVTGGDAKHVDIFVNVDLGRIAHFAEAREEIDIIDEFDQFVNVRARCVVVRHHDQTITRSGSDVNGGE